MGTGCVGMLGRKIVFVVDAGTGVFGRLRIFCHQCRFAVMLEGSAAMPGSCADECSLVLAT